MDIKELRTLIKLITETDITEFEMRGEHDKILIRRGPEKEYVQFSAPQPLAPPAQQAPAAPTPAPAAAEAAPAAAEEGETIKSPIVGTFYRKPSPDADPFVEVGATVEEGQTVCLVEAMKLFNEIEAEFRCKILEILKEDASPVEFGEPLYRIQRL